jgi:hypothetical protein
LVLAALLAAAASFYSGGELHHDPSFLLVATGRWLGGATLYRDIVEINPPWIFYLTAPSVIAARLLAISPSVAFITFVCALAGASLVWCWRLLARVASLSLGTRYAIITAAFAALIVTPGYNFGQREHVFIILALPYFVATGFTPAGLRPGASEKIALGLYAVLGIALKPYFIIPAALAGAFLCWQQRSFRPLFGLANLAIAAGLIAYAVLVITVHPDYLRTIVPFGIDIYGTIADDTANIPARAALPLAAIAATAALGQPSPKMRDSIRAFASVLLGLLVVFAIQRKAWDYQILPFDSMLVVVALAALAVAGRRALSQPVQFAILVAAPLVLLSSALSSGRYANPYPEAFASRLEAVAPNWKGKSVIVLTTNVSAAFPFINEIGAEWVGKYPYQWLVAGARTRQSEAKCTEAKDFCAELEGILDFARRTNVDDLAGHPPDVVLVDARPIKSYLPEEPFDYLTFLDGDPRFRGIWARYKKVDTVMSYDIWIRLDPSAAAVAQPAG